jgi:hypothetical protein
VQVISGALQIGNVLALAIFQIGKPESALVVERLDPGDKFNLGMVVGMQPRDRPVTAGADQQFIGQGPSLVRRTTTASRLRPSSLMELIRLSQRG